MMPISLGIIILLKEKGGLSESVPRQIDVWGPRGGDGSAAFKEETGVWSSQVGKKDKHFFYIVLF